MKAFTYRLFRKIVSLLTGRGLSKFPGFSFIYRFVWKIVRPSGIVLTEIEGSKMFVDSNDQGIAPYLLTWGRFEPFETEIFKSSLRQNMVVIDIGANIGYYTLIAARIAGEGGRVYAFEAEPRNFDLLVKNISVNGYKNILAVQKAVSAKCGTIKLFTDKKNLGNPSVVKDNVPEIRETVEAEQVTLDHFVQSVAEKQKIDFIKMDVQGAEGLIVEGAEAVLKQNKLKIIMEFWPYGLRNAGTDELLLLKKLRGHGFTIKVIDEVKQCMKEETIETIIEICKNTDSGKGFVNLFLEK